MGVVGLYDLTRARQSMALISPEMERTILSIRKRLELTYHPQTRYALIDASAIQAELKSLNIRAVPCVRTTEHALQRNGVTLPRVRLARFLPAHVGSGHKVSGGISNYGGFGLSITYYSATARTSVVDEK